MAQILHNHNLWDHIPEGAKKKPKYHASGKGNSSHSLIAINSSPYAWIVDLGTFHHMDSTKEFFSSLDAYKGPPILMGDDSPVKITGKGTIDLNHGSFENVLHVPKLSMNLLSVYHITHSRSRKRV